jgi:hypothetical protein
MAMNCKQFKHTERVEKKQQFSFNPAEVNYNTPLNETKDVTVKDVSLKRMALYFLIAIVVLSFIASQLN